MLVAVSAAGVNSPTLRKFRPPAASRLTSQICPRLTGTEGASHCYAPGGAWFEPGPEPVFARAADRPTRFIRVMVLPASLKGQSSIGYVNAEDRDKPKSQRYQVYLDAPVAL